MTKEELEKIENSMTKEQIIERARTLRPVAEFKKVGGMIFWVDGCKIHTEAYTWNLKRLKPTGYLRELGRVKTYHNGSPFFFKPSVDECVYQCPYPEATAFMVVSGCGGYNNELECWEAETIYYAGTMPEDIKNREIEW